MGRYLGPRKKLEKRFGLIEVKEKKKSFKKKSTYGLHLDEKQKVKFLYGVMERQLARYADKALKMENSPIYLLQELETRLDNVVYRLGFALSRQHARQLISHHHFLLNDKKHNIPSYLVKPGDIISIKKDMLDNLKIKEAIEKQSQIPSWLMREGNSGKVLSLPTEEEMPKEFRMEWVISFFV